MNEVVRFWVSAVKLVDQYPLFELGAALAELRPICERETDEPYEQLFALWKARQQIRKVLDGDHSLSYCRDAAEKLHDRIFEAEHVISKAEAGDKPTSLKTWQLGPLRQMIDIFEHQLSADLKKTASYSVPDRGIFHTEKLAENADRHIHETIRAGMTEFAIAEFRSAGRCLAFGLYSASGFHSARAVEDVLRRYYEIFLGPPPDKPMGLLASNLADMLKSKEVGWKPRENTVRHIRDITNLDRNPLIHRGVELKEIDATTMFNSAQGVIVEMVKEMLDIDRQRILPLPEPRRRRRPRNLLEAVTFDVDVEPSGPGQV